MQLKLGRRGFLRTLGWILAGLAVPLKAGARSLAAGTRAFVGPTPGFLSDHERATLAALCDRIVPPDSDPGAAALGAPAYIETLLTAFDVPKPRLFARGPFTLVGRNLMFHFQTNVNGFIAQRVHGQRGRAVTHGISDFRGVEPGGEAIRVLTVHGQPQRLPHLVRLQPDADHHCCCAAHRARDRRHLARLTVAQRSGCKELQEDRELVYDLAAFR